MANLLCFLCWIDNSNWNSIIPFSPSNFTGRETELESIDNGLLVNGSVVISGLPGLGKSSFAAKFAKGCGSDYNHLFWISAENTNAAATGFAKIYTDLGIVVHGNNQLNDEDIQKAVCEWLTMNLGYCYESFDVLFYSLFLLFFGTFMFVQSTFCWLITLSLSNFSVCLTISLFWTLFCQRPPFGAVGSLTLFSFKFKIINKNQVIIDHCFLSWTIFACSLELPGYLSLSNSGS